MKVEPVVIVDSREQMPWRFTLPTRVEGLQTGDYGLDGLLSLARVERKSLPDLVQCCGSERERFKRELERLAGFRFKLLCIESDAATIERGDWRGSLKPAHIFGALSSWSARWSIAVWLGGTPELCAAYVQRWFLNVARIVRDELTAANAILEYEQCAA